MRSALVCVLVAACGGGSSAPPIDGKYEDVDAFVPIAEACDPGQLATNVSADGHVACTAPDEATMKQTIEARCSTYLGWRDSCDGCTTAPAKWGNAGPSSCTVGAGANSCTIPDQIDGGPARLFGLDLDGDMDGNDKLYATLHCIAVQRQQAPAPCAPGFFVTGKLGNTWMCSAMSEIVVSYIRDNCAVYLGWADSCNGCSTTPAKYGFAGDGTCMATGTDDTCTDTTLGGQVVKLIGINTDGDVNGDDKFFYGLHCKAPADPGAPSGNVCPSGTFVTGTNTDGTPVCTSALGAIGAYFKDHCSSFFGWRDGCGACTDPPTKIGAVRDGACATSGGVDDTCTDMNLASETVSMFGMSPDGNVNDDDKFYTGLRCD